ncbi:MAG: Ig-like domain-containing protein, partial [Planctomycetota bacterium]
GTEPNVIYEPDQDFNGEDRFTFKINDGSADSAPATISITVMGATDTPIANSQSVTVQEDKELPIILTGNDPDGDPLTFAVLRNPAHGALTGKAPNVIYTPDPNFSWLDSFTFKVSDGTTESTPATVSISVTPVNDPPKAHDDVLVTEEDKPATIDVLANDTEVDNEVLKVTAATKSAGGSVTVNPNGTLTYTPNADFYGKDTFTYIVTDGQGMTDSATVRVEVTSANDAPSITSKPVTVAMVGVQYAYDVDARDPDGTDKLSYSLTSAPSGMTIEPDTGMIRWTPTERQKGETFAVAVKVTDSVPASDVQQYDVRVKPTPAKAATLSVADGYDHNARRRLSADGRIEAIKASDDKRIESGYGSTISYDFSEVSIPPGAKIAKVVLYVEHYEDESFPLGKLKWEIGKGWPDKPTVWFTANASIYKGKDREATDSWDITSFGNTPEKVNALQLRIQNTDSISGRKTFVNHVRVLVEWDWPVSRSPAMRRIGSKITDDADDGLVLIRQ